MKILDFSNFKDFADKIGVSPQVFYDIKSGKHGISKKLAEKIAQYDERISVSWLLTGDGGADLVPIREDEPTLGEMYLALCDHDVRFHELANRILDGMGVGKKEGRTA